MLDSPILEQYPPKKPVCFNYEETRQLIERLLKEAERLEQACESQVVDVIEFLISKEQYDAASYIHKHYQERWGEEIELGEV